MEKVLHDQINRRTFAAMINNKDLPVGNQVSILTVRAGQRSIKITGINELVNLIRDGKYAKKVCELRAYYPYLPLDSEGNTNTRNLEIAKNIPEVCFSAIMKNDSGNISFDEYTGLVLLEIKNLQEYDDARSIRQAAMTMPQTMLTFLGADGRSVEIVCRTKPAKGELPQTEMAAGKFQLKAYEKAFAAYTSQLGISIDNLEPKLNRTCLMSVDDEVFYRNDVLPFYIDMEEEVKMIKKVKLLNDGEAREKLLPGYDQNQTDRYVYECCLDKSIEESRLEPKDTYVPKVLTLLSRYCRKCGLPKELCVKMTLFNSDIGKDEEYVRKVFGNAYLNNMLKKMPMKAVPQSALMTFKTEAMLTDMFEMRRNIITGEVQFRRRNGFDYGFRAMTDIEKRDITIRALKDGLDTWDKDMTRMLGSSMSKDYDPINDYLSRLPKWDQVNRIAELANRIPTDNPDWTKYFYVWMMSMVAQWQNKCGNLGNAIIPLLIGYQGCGKSSFCNNILPPELMDYYNDKLNFENENAVMRALSQFAMINIDEFDSLKKSQQPMLKYLVQKSDVKLRKMYGQNIENRRRYASFIGTTNLMMPLTDETGSRRFVCTKVTGPIDFLSPIDYEQLYAQAVEEVKNGCRYWFNDEENKRIQKWNLQYTKPSSIAIMLSTIITKPKNENDGEKILLSDLIKRVSEKYTNFDINGSSSVKIGMYLSQQGYYQKRDSKGITYRVKFI